MARVCILGAGFGGLAAGLLLRQAGHEVQLLERASRVGGTWRDNVYPGVACDVRSHLYSLSFEPNAEWSRRYASGAEIQAYLEALQERHQLPIRFGSEVLRQDWSGDRWRLSCADGHVEEARFVVNAIGGLRDPRWPDLPGRFEGTEMHSARWDPELDLSGLRVGVVGTGASAIQVVPGLAGHAAEVHLFQRTPAWVAPRHDRPYGALERWGFREVPGLMELTRLAIYLRQEAIYYGLFGGGRFASRAFRWLYERRLRAALGPELSRRLLPDYTPGCKRVLLSDDYYPALQRDDVHLHGAALARLPGGVRTSEGEVALDALVYCTGFHVDDPLGRLEVFGRQGQSLRAFWNGRPRAYLGVTVPGFPNAFTLLGPNTALGHSSVLIMIEAQLRWILQALELAGEGVLDTRPEALERFVREVDQTIASQVWMSGCRSWYLNERGENFTIWPGSTLSYLWRMRRLEPDAFRVER